MFGSVEKAALAIALSSGLAFSGCAEHPNRIAPVYIPSIVYKGASCAEITREQGRLANYVRNLTATQAQTANNDTAALTVGLVIFWPAIAVLPFTVDQTAQLAVARGHYDALLEAARTAGCASGAPSQMYRYPNGKMFPGVFPPM